MWSDWLVSCDYGFHFACLWWRKIRGLWKFPVGRDWGGNWVLFWLARPHSVNLNSIFRWWVNASTFRVYYNCLLKWSCEHEMLDSQGLGLGSNPVWWSHLCFWFLCLWFKIHNMEIIILVQSLSQRTKKRSHCQEWIILNNILTFTCTPWGAW